MNISGKLGSAVFDPADTTNCLTCVKNYTFIDHGYTDCTGHCKKQLPEEVARRAALSMGTGALLSQASNADTNNEALQDSIRTKYVEIIQMNLKFNDSRFQMIYYYFYVGFFGIMPVMVTK